MIDKQTAVAVSADGKPIDAYTLATPTIRARILTYGGILTHLFVPDRKGRFGDVVLGFDDDAQYLQKHAYFGAIIGRYGNRIADCRFTLDSVVYALPANDGPHHLHGGPEGYDKRLWHAEPLDDVGAPALRLTLRDPDGTAGYPGNVDVAVTYTLSGGTLRIDYEATSDRATPINLTNHSYFNLKDGGASTILDHRLRSPARAYLPVGPTLIPTGAAADVRGTPIDFTAEKPIGTDLLAMGGEPPGYDHSLIVAGLPTGAAVATVREPTSGRSMEVRTGEPAVQFYSGNFLDGTLVGKGGVAYERRSGFCLETQHYPDAPNQPAFPNTILRPGQMYRSWTEYRFSAE